MPSIRNRQEAAGFFRPLPWRVAQIYTEAAFGPNTTKRFLLSTRLESLSTGRYVFCPRGENLSTDWSIFYT